MTDTTPSWADHTFNPWIYGAGSISSESFHFHRGVTKMLSLGAKWGTNGSWRSTARLKWEEPLAWNQEAMKSRQRSRVFCASLCDIFEDRSELVKLRGVLFELIGNTPGLDWLLVTRKPENIQKMLPAKWVAGWSNVWLGCPAEDQQGYDQRIEALLKVPAQVHFLVADPLIGAITLRHGKWEGLTWVVVGGESGSRFHPMDLDWARRIRDDCAAKEVTFFFNRHSGPDPKRASDQLDGQLHLNWPKGKAFPRGRPKRSNLTRAQQEKAALQKHRKKYSYVPVDRELVDLIDQTSGPSGRVHFIAEAIARALKQKPRAS